MEGFERAQEKKRHEDKRKLQDPPCTDYPRKEKCNSKTRVKLIIHPLVAENTDIARTAKITV